MTPAPLEAEHRILNTRALLPPMISCEDKHFCASCSTTCCIEKRVRFGRCVWRAVEGRRRVLQRPECAVVQRTLTVATTANAHLLFVVEPGQQVPQHRPAASFFLSLLEATGRLEGSALL
jgi:hypothetical protein